MKKYEQDFTQGNLWTQIFKFSIPLIFSNLLQVLFNMADIAVVGKFGSANSLGSVGSTTILVTLFTSLLIGFSAGINVLVAHAIGAKNNKEVKEVVFSGALLSVILGLLVMFIGIFFSEIILQLLDTKPELIDGANLYLKIYFMGMPALSLYNFGNSVLSAAGDTKRPLIFLSIAGVINIILNLFFVIVCKLDVAGVAIASIISQYISAILVILTLIRSDEVFALKLREFHFYKSRILAILSIGIPACLQNAIFQFANLFVQKSVNYFSATMVSGNSAAANADALVYDVMAAFYSAAACFIGQNYGAGKNKRILKSYFITLLYSFGSGAVIGIGLLLCGENFLALFTDEAEVIEAGMQRLTIMSFSYAISAFMDATIAASRGLGKTVIPTVVVIMGSCVFRLIWIWTVFAYFKTITSLYLLYIFSWTITAIAEIIYFVYVYRKEVAKKCTKAA